MKFKRYISGIMSTAILIGTIGTVNLYANENKLIAFPGAEGGGMYTQGARAGKSITVYHVTNLNDSGEGSFRDAVSAGNRIIVFDVAGTVKLNSILQISASNLTILGQTAPGNGICIGGESVLFRGCNNIIMRYMRFRAGDTSLSQEDALGGRDCTNVIIDHCSVSWSVDECFSWYGNTNFTAQWNIISESLRDSIHGKGAHGYGGIWGGINASFHHNLITTHDSRTPRIGSTADVNTSPDDEAVIDIRNNVIYNWGNYSAYGGENGVRVNLVNNYYKPTDNSRIEFYRLYDGDVKSTTLHVSGNVMENNSGLSQNNWSGVISSDSIKPWIKRENIDSAGVIVQGNKETGTADDTLPLNSEYLSDYPINTQSAQDAYEDVIKYSGANFWRDPIDERVIDSVINGTYPTGSKGSKGFIDSQDDVGGWVLLKAYNTPVDSDSDGIPDEWEDKNSLNKNDPSDSILIAANGYTNIENYANDLVSNIEPSQLDKSELYNTIIAASNLNADNYDASLIEKINKLCSEGYELMSSDAPQTELDAKTEEIKNAMAGLQVLYKNMLVDLVNSQKSTDISQYTPFSQNAINSALEKAENDLANNANNDVYKEDYENLLNAIDALEISEAPKLKIAIESAESITNADKRYSTESFLNLQAVIAKAKEDYESPLGTNEMYLSDIEALNTAKQALIKSNKADLKTFIEYALKVDTTLFGTSYSDILESVKAAEAVFESDETDNFDAANTIYDISSKAKQLDNNIGSKTGGILYNRDYENTSNLNIRTENNNSFIELDQNTEYSFEHDFDNGRYVFSTDFRFDNLTENVIHGKLQGYNFGSYTLSFYAEKSGGEYKVWAYVEKNGGMGVNEVKDRYSCLYMNFDDWNNITTVLDTDTMKMTSYINNILWLDSNLAENSYDMTNLFSYGIGPIGILVRNSDKGMFLDNDVIYSSNIAQESYIYGDVSCDGVIAADDAAYLLQKTLISTYKMPIESKTDDWLKYSDVNADGQIAADDAAFVLQKTLISTYKMPAEQ